MAEIQIGPLSQRLGEEEIEELAGGLERLGAPQLPQARDDSPLTIGDGVDDDALGEFLDRLEPHDIACEIYLPVEFDGRVEVANLRVGSAVTLLDVLDEMRDDLDISDGEDEDEDDEDEDEDEDDEEPEELETGRQELRRCWKLLFEGANAAVDRKVALHIAV